MKQRISCILVSAALMTVVLYAGGKLENERRYGGKFTHANSVSVLEIINNTNTYLKREVVFEGTISQVCQNKGCWMLVSDGLQKVRVDFKNYSFFVPWDSEGKRVRVQGKVNRRLVTKEVLRHWAEESKSPELKPEDIKEDQMIVTVTASAVAIENGSELTQDQQEVVSGKAQKDH